MGDNSSEKRTLDPIIDDDTKRRLWDEAQKATPDHVLETQLHDSRIPKPEIVHYASRKIKALEAEVERLREQLAERERYWRDWNGRAANHAAKIEAEIERLKAEYHETLQMAANQAVTIKKQIEEIEQMRAEILAQMTQQAQAQGEYDDRAGDAAE